MIIGVEKKAPKFSVIIPSVNGLPTIAECLTAIERQDCDFGFEIIVADRTNDGTKEYIQENFPLIKLIETEKNCGIPEMRAIAVEQAHGEYLVVTEDHCIAPENWLTEIFKAHESGYDVVGGAVENGCEKRLIDRAVFLCEYSSFMPPICDGEVHFVTGNNTSYRRSAIEKLDKNLLKNYWEYFWQNDLRQSGIKFLSVSNLIISHKKEFGFLYFLGQRFHYSRSFAAMRKQRSSVSEQIIYLLYTPFLPIHLIWRIFRNVLEKKTNYGNFFLSLPLLFIFMVSYASGEFIGQIFGAGDSLSKVE